MNEFEIGSMVSFDQEGEKMIGMVEEIQESSYKVRVYAKAGEMLEPTDSVLELEKNACRDYFDEAVKMFEEEPEPETDPEPEAKAEPDALSVGDFVRWESAGGTAYGQVREVVTSGEVEIEDTEFELDAVETNPVAVIAVMERTEGGWRDAGVTVGHHFSDLERTDALEVVSSDKSNDRKILVKMRDMKMDVSDDIGIIEGWGSVYGNTDLGGDIVAKTAFDQTLVHNNGRVKLLLDHGYTTKDVAGVAFCESREKGLWVRGEMPLDIPEVANAYKRIKFLNERGIKMGMSIGYNVIKAKPKSTGEMELLELALEEMSITPFPMNTQALIMDAKSCKLKRREKALAWQQVKPLTKKEIEAVKTTQESEGALNALLIDLKQITTLLKEK